MAQYAELHDGTRLEFPDETPPDVIQRVVKQHLGQQVQPQQPEQRGTLANIGMGALKGASNIGATILQPVDWATDVLMKDREQNLQDVIAGRKPLSRNEERRLALQQFFQENANPESLAFKGGELGSEIAGTAGVGGAIARPVMAAAKYIPGLSRLGTAIESGGFATGAPIAETLAGKALNAATRVGGGAIAGGAQAGLVNPQEAGTGAILGGAIPIAGKVAGILGEKLGKSMSVSPEVSALAEKAKAQGIDIPADRLVNSPALNALAASLRYLPFSGRAGAEAKMEGQLQRAVSRTFGQDSENITKALRDAHNDLGSKFENTLKENSVKVDDTFLNDASLTLEKAKNELSEGDFKIVENQINNVLAKAKDGVIDGPAAYNIKKDLDRISARNSNEAWYANQLKKDLMGALNRSLGSDKAAEFAKVRQQYGNMLDLEPLAKAGAEGDISVARLANMRNINNPQLQEVADIAAQFVKPRESQHGAMQRIVLGGLGAGAMGAGFAAPVVAGLTGGRLANALLQSDIAKKALLSSKQNTQALADLLRNPALRAGIATAGAD